ncbi:hypothetical protein H2200_006305 [Cladophialophora chaetospira]|uniref:Uncharacterized protein n=1 Tax=Cladophialophora chaetospira TaxID=386627 RepID=A0AA39CJ57_9EURO|nr:hypothetical protein H2200_006305 [Cladophialophora chaetospira]
MPVTFHSLTSIKSAPGSLQTDTLLTPLVSQTSFDDVPFKPPDDDHVSLSMKRKRRHQHRRHDTLSQEPAAPVKTKGRRQKNTRPDARSRTRSLRKTNSLPSVQPRFEPGTIETFATPEALPQRARRWTVPSKAPSTCGLATLVPVNDIANRADTNTRGSFSTKQSPAMITLRRATTVRSRRQTTTLTSFPPPKFSRDSTGLLSSFLNSIASYSDIPVVVDTTTELARQTMQKSRKVSMEGTPNYFRPSMGAVAAPVQTEVVAVEPRSSSSGPSRAANSMRRCSTRYISDNIVYEIIWDENSNSSPSSEGGNPSPPGRGAIVPSRELAGAEPLERRLSNALTRSRRTSVQEGMSRRTSWVPGLELSVQNIWTNPKIARLFREPASDRLPYSKSSKRTNMVPALPTDSEWPSQCILEDEPEQRVSVDHVEFFPPLRSRANTHGSGEPEVKSILAADLVHGHARSRFGSMVGASSHIPKRQSMSAVRHDKLGWRKSISFGGRRASEGQKRVISSEEESVPLLLGAA